MARVLIVDDSSFMRFKLDEMVKKGRHETYMAVDGVDGLEKVRTLNPDCMITDNNMPNMTGVEMLTALKEQHIQVPTIVSTADVQEATREACLALGVLEFLNKPINEKVLLAAIDKAIAAHQETLSCS